MTQRYAAAARVSCAVHGSGQYPQGMSSPTTDHPVSEPALDDEPPIRTMRAPGGLFTVGGLIGLVAAAVLLVEKIMLAENPDYVPSCSINPVLSCGSVMQTDQAAAFGFPNPIIGVGGFAALLAIGLGILAGARFARWYWAGVQLGVTFGVVFIHWLAYQSLYVIGALCPYCMVVWVVTIPVFLFTTIYNLQPARQRGNGFAAGLSENRWVILTAWYAVFVLLIGIRFWDYWSTLI